MSHISSILLRIKKALRVCGTTIRDVIKDCDHHSRGIISSMQLQRALSSCGIHLTNPEIRSIESEFSSENGISISALIAAVEMAVQQKEDNYHPEIFDDLVIIEKRLGIHHQTLMDVLRQFDRMNDGNITTSDFIRALNGSPESQRVAMVFQDPSSKLINYRKFLNNLSIALRSQKPNPQPSMPKFVKSLISMIIRRGIDIAQVFKSHDKLRIGKLSTSSFAMILSTIGNIQMLPQEMQEVTRYYFDGNGMVNYVKFLKDIDNAVNNVQSFKQKNENNQELNAPQVNVRNVMDQIMASCQNRRISLSSLFSRTRSGTISRYVFVRILAQANLGLTSKEIDAVANEYMTPNNDVDMNKFLAYFVPIKKERSYADFNKIIQYITSVLTNNGVNVHALFRRVDRDGTGIVPVNTVNRALQQSGINLGPTEINEILRLFPGNELGTVNVHSLIKAISPYVQYKPSNSINETAPSHPQKLINIPKPSKFIYEILTKISYVVKMKDIHLFEEFQVYDKMKHSSISKQQFIDFIFELNTSCSPVEIEAVAMHYSQGREFFDYVSFCKDIQSCINNKGIFNPRDETESPELTAVLKRIKALLLYRMMDMNDLFLQYDQMHNGTVPLSSISSIFTNNGLLLNQNELNELSKYYKDGLTRDRFNYKLLARRVDHVVIPKDQIEKSLFPGYHDDEINRELYSARSEIREKLHVRRKNAYIIYSGTNKTTISETEFFNRLENAGIVIMKLQREALAKYYSVGNEIDWKRFADDVENSNIISNIE